MSVDPLSALTELREVERAIDLSRRAVANAAAVTVLQASDAAQSFRSVAFAFTIPESATIFAAALTALEARQAAIKASLAI